MKKIFVAVFLTAVLVSGLHMWMLRDSPGGFWVYPLNRSECKLASLELISDRYTVKFSAEQIQKAELASGAPQLFVPVFKETEFRLFAHFDKCQSMETGAETIRKGSGYYIQIKKDKVALDKRV